MRHKKTEGITESQPLEVLCIQTDTSDQDCFPGGHESKSFRSRKIADYDSPLCAITLDIFCSRAVFYSLAVVAMGRFGMRG